MKGRRTGIKGAFREVIRGTNFGEKVPSGANGCFSWGNGEAGELGGSTVA
ncbi:MAG: hypothetical protein AAGU16_05390 [Desulfitobacterium hafniense]